MNTQYIFDILPLLYEYMPAYTIGNVELIKLLAAMIVPDQVGLNHISEVVIHGLTLVYIAWEYGVTHSSRENTMFWREHQYQSPW